MASSNARAGQPSVSRRIPPLVAITLALLAGQLLSARHPSVPIPLTLAAAVCGVGLVAVRRRVVGATVLALTWGHWSAASVAEPSLSDIATWSGPMVRTVEGRLQDDPVRTPGRVQLRIAAEAVVVGQDRTPVRGTILVTARRLRGEWQADDRVRARLRLRRPRNFGNPGEFDYQAYLARQGVYATAFADDEHAIELLARSGGGSWLTRWRRGVGGLIDRTVPMPTSAVLRALVIGDMAAMPLPLRKAFTRAGVSHVLSISGLHVGLVAAGGYWVVRWLLSRSAGLLLLTNLPKVSGAVSIVPVLLYAGIAGSNTATLRALFMVLVFMVAVQADRRRDLIVSLAVAAFIICALWPGAVLDISFQLSFAAVLFLVLGMQRFWPWWQRWEEHRLVRLRADWTRWARPVAAYLAVSLWALAGTTPLTAFHFNQVSLIGVIANALIVPLLGGAAVACGLLAALIYPLAAGPAQLLLLAAWPIVAVSTWLVEWMAATPFASVRVVTPSVEELAIMYAVLLALVGVRGAWRQRVLALLTVIVLVDVGWWHWERARTDVLRVTFLSVGQGDCAVVECPGSQTVPASVMVIDGGGLGDGSFDVGERVIAPFLWSRKIAHIDTLVLSHPDWDHYGGFAFLVRNFAPREFWSAGDTARGSVRFAELQAALRDGQVSRRVIEASEIRSCGAVPVRVLGPRLKGGSPNNRSLVLQLEHGGTRLLFTGDIEREGEEVLLGAARGAVRSEVVKVAHHGSATSSSPEFVTAAAPRVAIASLGRDNRFGFPNPATERTYRAVGARFLRTDGDGAVTVTVDAAGAMTVRAVHPPSSESGGPSTSDTVRPAR